MAPKPYAVITRIETEHGAVSVRRLYAPKQASFIVVFDGPQSALLKLLPGWKPRSPSSTRTQITPPIPCATALAISTFWEALAPKLQQRATAPSDPFVATGSSPPPSAYTTLGAAATILQKEVATSVRPSSARTYARQWSSLLRRIPANTPLTDLTRERLQHVVGELVSEGLSSVTIHNLFVSLGRVLTRAVDDKVLPHNPLARVKLPKIVARPRVVLTSGQRDHLLQVAARSGRDIHLLISIGIMAGARRAELLALTWDDVDCEARILHIRNSNEFTTKSGQSGTVPICAELLTVLTKYRRPHGYIIAPLKQRAGPSRWCFQKSFDRVVREAGFPKLTVHGLRHTFATAMARSGVSIVKLKGWLHHSSIKVTEAYLHGLAEGYDIDIEKSSAG